MIALFLLIIPFAVIEQAMEWNRKAERLNAERIQRDLDAEHAERFGWTSKDERFLNN